MSSQRVVATAEVKIVDGKKQGQRHGFQVCKLVDADGGYQKFEAYYNPGKDAFALTPGEHEVVASEPKVVDGKLVIYANFQPVSSKAKAAA